MKSFQYIVKDPGGIHARPAGMLVKVSKEFSSKINLISNHGEAETSRILSIMTLGVKQGEEVTISAEGEDEEIAIQKLELFFQENL